MRGCFGGCLGRILALALFAAVLLVAWLNRERLAGIVGGLRDDAAEPVASADLAAAAERKLALLEAESPPRRIAFGEAEVQSLIQYRIGHALPPYLLDPRVSLEGEVMRVHARVPTEAMPSLPGAGEFASLLPDTTDVAARAQLLPLDSGRVALAIDEMTAAKIPLPERMVPALLRRIGREDEPGLPPDALAMRLPSGACSAYIRGDSLILLTPARAGRCD